MLRGREARRLEGRNTSFGDWEDILEGPEVVLRGRWLEGLSVWAGWFKCV